MKKIGTIVRLSVCLICVGIPVAWGQIPLLHHKNVQAFIRHMVKQHHFHRAALDHLFHSVNIQSEALQKEKHPAESKPWFLYRQKFLTPKRVKDGARFWRKYGYTLRRAQRRYGVPPKIIVAIIGVARQWVFRCAIVSIPNFRV